MPSAINDILAGTAGGIAQVSGGDIHGMRTMWNSEQPDNVYFLIGPRWAAFRYW